MEALIRERAQLDVELERYQQLLTIMFTDIAGSTKYYEEHGDLAGLVMVQRTNDMLYPCIAKYAGRVIKTIGDAIMAQFDDPVGAVRAGVLMQQTVDEFNSSRAAKDQIHIRAALNLGLGLLKDMDVFGDVVNVASRIEHATEKDRVGVSPSVVEAVQHIPDIYYRQVGAVTLRGKAQKLDLYEILWRKADIAEAKKKRAPLAKLSSEQLALATGTQIGLADDVRAAIAAATGTGAARAAAPPEELTVQYSLVLVRPDGSPGGRYKVKAPATVLGREEGDILFPEDPVLSSQHARFRPLNKGLQVDDLDSANGIYLRLRQPRELHNNDVVLLGRQKFRFQAVTASTTTSDKKSTVSGGATVITGGEFIRVLRGGEEEKHFKLQPGETTFGRKQGTYTFPEDGYLSGRHATVRLGEGKCILDDPGSTNGSYVKIRKQAVVQEGDIILVGAQHLKVLAEKL